MNLIEFTSEKNWEISDLQFIGIILLAFCSCFLSLLDKIVLIKYLIIVVVSSIILALFNQMGIVRKKTKEKKQ